ncbi:parallel beta-helix domain-containing protein [Marinobacter sp. BGYM27]|uniref:parallel beta-helix domain-containing protein n=1 Tax=unclassified Marinobacter TaxID=83889 RepID=UPI0021A26BC6|nr:parallel beta-helix domain-containing protein [Marinobacter sp. BGYM27]MDG5498383.1 parallel beta-helix domain-containing protein [Marinobacter sp. BGYM27]
MTIRKNAGFPHSAVKTGLVIGAVALTGILAGCGGSSDSDDTSSTPQFPEGAVMLDAGNLTQSAKEAFINAKSGDVIVFPEGRFDIDDTLGFDASTSGTSIENITITGYGKDKTILDFSGSAGGDGIYIQNGMNVTIKNIGVYEAANNGIKLKNTDGIHIQSVATVWEGALDQDNGAYGLYPVESQNILIEDSYVRGSADAGVYVGQSSNIVLRRNEAVENVAGIEIENSTNADVYDNVATGNTGGILVFDLPIGNHLYGSTVRVFDNEVSKNNAANFANASSNPAGVHIVPPGTGVIVLSTSDVEIYKNEISDHKTTSVAITSYYLADETLSYATHQNVIDDGWDPVPRNIHVHDNAISTSGSAPEGKLIEDIINGYVATAGAVPALLYDGLGELLANAGADPQVAGAPFADGDRVCAENNVASYGQVYGTDPSNPANIDGSGPKARLLFETTQSALLNCATPLPRLSAAKATINGKSYGCGSSESGDSSAASCAL